MTKTKPRAKPRVKKIRANFESVTLWLRIKIACAMWWDIVVNKGLDCIDDEVGEKK